MKNLILGSANFGQNYGISNKTELSALEINKILIKAFRSEITTIDTSPEYGQAERIIGNFLKENNLKKNIKIITKMPKNLSLKKEPEYIIKKTLENSIKNLSVPRIDTLLIHDIKDFMKVFSDKTLNLLNDLKKSKIVKKIGVSIYEKNDLKEIKNMIPINVVQLPISIIDQRPIENGLVNELKKKKIKVHGRSIFLQGLIFMNPNKIPSNCRSLKYSVKKIQDFCKKRQISVVKLCFMFLNTIKDLDSCVVGINSLKHFNEILVFQSSQPFKKICFKSFASNNEEQIDPRYW
jgi:aryl-alcohol dehydrogenase-like predicted oxidoreductase